MFKIRCSAISQIMTEGKGGITELQLAKIGELQSKAKLTDKQNATLQELIYKRDNPQLSQTAKSYCELWVKEQIYNRKKEISSKYLNKGTINEDESIDFISDYLNFGFLVKNDKYFGDNKSIHGTPDIITKDYVIDVKNSWDCFTFPLFDKAPPSNYWWQLQGYMELTGKDKAMLVFTLTDTPIHLIEKEAYFYCKENGYGDMDIDIYDMFVNKMTYSDIPDDKKIKVFEFEKDNNAVNKIYERVEMCRNYIKTL